jgi:hypothetical protein
MSLPASRTTTEENMKDIAAKIDVEKLKKDLNRIRELSLAATRQNDSRTVARLTSEAARLNRAIHLQTSLNDGATTVLDAIADLSKAGRFVFPIVGESDTHAIA